MTSHSDTTPYANLDPSLILDGIENLGFHCNGSLFPLNSYENRVYQIGVEDKEPLIAKFYRPNRWTDEAILEEHQFSKELADLEIPVIAPLLINGASLHAHQGYRFALFPRKGGRPLELDNNDQLEWMGRFIGRLHAVGSCQTFKHRIQLTAETYGDQSYRYLMENDFLPAELRQNYQEIVTVALDKIRERFAQAGNVQYIRLHGDCHAGNVLWDNGPHIVDLDDCLMGPAIQDIWMLLSGASSRDMRGQLNHILTGYEEFHEFDDNEIKLIEPLRILRMLHYSAWLAKRWEDPTFPRNFPWFNTEKYWQEHIQNISDQIYYLDN